MSTYVKGDAVANATSYELLEKTAEGAYTSLAEASEINFELDALSLEAGDHTLVVKAKADGYEDSDASNEVVYTVEEAEEEAEWEIYSADGVATVASDENGIPTVTGTSTKATVLMKNTNSNFSFTSPVASTTDGGKMVVFGRYDSNVLAFRPRGESTGTNLQRYNYTSFSGAALSTDASAVNTFAAGDTLKVTWEGNTASLYVNDTLQSSFDCSSYVENETWQKCAGFMYTALTGTTFTLSDFTLL